MKKALIICGPTASGKTEIAHEIAKHKNGEIINADSMQLYKQLPIITASPSEDLKNELPYHLYNFQDADQEFSSAKYVQAAMKAINQVVDRGRLPIIVGGSGMYISMLINGYSDIPDIDKNVRIDARNLHQEIGHEEFFRQLVDLDPSIKNILNIGDTQRVIRAYEIIKQTGKSVLFFQNKPNILPLPDFEFTTLLLMPSRNILYETCNSRFEKIFNNGGVDEVKNLYKNYGELKTSAMKALGVSQIISFIKGEIDSKEAIDLASTKTRQYAKRQTTWFNNQIKDKKTISFDTLEQYNQIKKSCTNL